VPAAIVLALVFHAWPTGHFLQRTFLSMIVHELGHAVTAWWCGYGAVPGLWKTLIPEARGVVAPIVVLAASGGLVYVGVVTERRIVIAIGAILAAAMAIGTFALSGQTAHVLITFGGDAGAMILGTMLMMTFFVPPDHRLAVSHLRWGFLVIGAAAYIDSFATWVSGPIPFGEIEGVGASDPSRLVDDFGWTQSQLVHRYQWVGAVCAIALAIAWYRAVTSYGRIVRASPT
jgi:hypothetical protein